MGEIRLPEFRIFYLSPQSGLRTEAEICPGPQPDLFYAHFHEDNVDFEIEMENKTSERSVRVDLEVQGKKFTYVLTPLSHLTLTTLRSNGGKLHFICQSREDAESMVCLAARAHNIEMSQAAIMVSQIKFRVTFSEDPTPFIVNVQNGSRGVFDVQVSPSDTIDSLKNKISIFSGITENEQILSFMGQVLGAGFVRDYKFGPDSMLNLKSKPKVVADGIQCRFYGMQQMDKRRGGDLFADGKVRGVICTGEKSNQVIKSSPFIPDTIFDLKPFIIELRMAPRYSLVD